MRRVCPPAPPPPCSTPRTTWSRPTPRTTWSRRGTPTPAEERSSATSAPGTGYTVQPRLDHGDLGSADGGCRTRSRRVHRQRRPDASFHLRPDEQSGQVPRLRLHDDARRDEARLRPPIRRRMSRTRSRSRAALSQCNCRLLSAADPSSTQPVADPGRVLRLRLREPGGPGERHRGPRQPDGLRGRRGQHPGHRLLGRLVPLPFEPLQSLDGYDAVETIAAQLSFVKSGKVGLVGISYPGISQLYVGADSSRRTSRPSRRCRSSTTATAVHALARAASSTPASPCPGPRSARTRPRRADPSDPGNGASRTRPRADRRRATRPAQANQALHPEASDLLAKIRANDHYVPDGRRPALPDRPSSTRSTSRSSWPASGRTSRRADTARRSREHMTGTDKKWFTYTNGVHTDSLDPETYNKLFDFLSLYVAQQNPATNLFKPVFQASWPVGDAGDLGDQTARVARRRRDASLPAGSDPGPNGPPDHRQRSGRLRGPAQIRVLFDNGAGNASHPGWPYPGCDSRSRASRSGNEARSWYVSPGGSLADGAQRPAADGPPGTPTLGPPTNFTGDTGSGDGGLGPRCQLPWCQDPDWTAVSYVTSRLDQQHGRDRRRASRPGSAPRPPTSTFRQRSARSGPTARRPSCRAAGSRPGRARSIRPRARNSSPSRASSKRTSQICLLTTSSQSRSPSTTRVTCIAPARRSASGSARPTATSRSGHSRRPTRPARRTSRSAMADRCPRGSSSRSYPA